MKNKNDGKDTIELEVRVEREIVYKEESSWGMYGCVPANLEDYSKVILNKYGNMSVKGVVHRLDIGAVYKLTATVEESKQWGTQYSIVKIRQDIPSTPEQVKEYVRNLVTPLQFESIYEVYEGQDIIELMKNDEFNYEIVKGMGSFTYEKIKEKLLKNLELQELVNEFPELDYKTLLKLLTGFSSVKLLKEKFYENPYIITEIDGIGFKKADKIALEIGVERTSQYRIHSALKHVMKEAEMSGDTYITESKLIIRAYELLKVKKPIIKDELQHVKEFHNIGERYCFKKRFIQESELAKMILDRKNNSKELNFDVDDFIKKQEDRYKIKLTDQQKSLFYNFKKENVVLLVGYAGCGKSMLQKLLINLMEEELGLSYALMAPTGKASKVLSQYTGRSAFTIHKKTGMGQNTDENTGVKIMEDVIIVDEFSMCDLNLAHALLSKIEKEDARILFIGDDFQLPSISCGAVLRDLIDSKQIAVTKLDIVFRQSEGGILDIVTKVREGKKIVDNDFVGVKKFGKNCLLVSSPQDKMSNGYVYYYKKMLKAYGKDNIMVLSPTKKGKLGTFAVNASLQEIVNPAENRESIRQVKDGNEVFFREDDLVINTVNTYGLKDINDEKIDIMNGDTGFIVDLNEKDNKATVSFDDVSVTMSNAELRNVLHAYCITMHKSQGSASKSVLSITDRAHTYQLNANLIYTAWSRAQEFLVILCQAETINNAVRVKENLRRNTFLCELLTGKTKMFLQALDK